MNTNVSIACDLIIPQDIRLYSLKLSCARIDNNRREYWREKLRKLVYMRVCSAFFFFVRTFVQFLENLHF